MAGDSAYHPVRDWIDRTEWDGVDRMEAFCNTLTTDKDAIDDRLKAILLTKWMLGAVMAVYADKPEAQHGVIVLQGAQGLGKTRWIKALCPIDDAVKDGLKIDASKVDSIRQVTRHWITELGELDGTFKKSEIADLKAFLTQQSDSYRLPYFITMEDYPRRTAFIASVNESQYLIDDTGNRRFWTIPVTAINHTHDLNMQQVWAQVKTMYEAGGKWYLLDSELAQLNDHNRDYEASNPYQDAIGTGFFFDQVDKYSNAMTAGQIAVHCGYIAPNKQTANGFAKALRAMGFIDKLQKIKGVTGRYFIMPECR
jgi:putative DNA primase/helicase